jgi:hypothetical protein
MRRVGRHQDRDKGETELTRQVRQARATELRRRRSVLRAIVRGRPFDADDDLEFAQVQARELVSRLPRFWLQGVVFLLFAISSVHVLFPLNVLNAVLLTVFALALLFYIGCAVCGFRIWRWTRRQPPSV